MTPECIPLKERPPPICPPPERPAKPPPRTPPARPPPAGPPPPRCAHMGTVSIKANAAMDARRRIRRHYSPFPEFRKIFSAASLEKGPQAQKIPLRAPHPCPALFAGQGGDSDFPEAAIDTGE